MARCAARTYCLHCFRTLDPNDPDEPLRTFVRCTACGATYHAVCWQVATRCYHCNQTTTEAHVVTVRSPLSLPTHSREPIAINERLLKARQRRRALLTAFVPLSAVISFIFISALTAETRRIHDEWRIAQGTLERATRNALATDQVYRLQTQGITDTVQAIRQQQTAVAQATAQHHSALTVVAVTLAAQQTASAVAQRPTATQTLTATRTPTVTRTPMPTATPVPPQVASRLCSGSPPPRLAIGDRGYVVAEYGASNLNRYPRRSGNNNIVVDIIPPNGTFTVIDGPVCGDGYTWWRVRRTSNGFIGWLAEGQGDVYWLAKR
ncbi:MAG: hypothetical protein RML95_12145 [Anaerolineae bacterium]|nr:hypothetical protein [Anaerolineae bacterium]